MARKWESIITYEDRANYHTSRWRLTGIATKEGAENTEETIHAGQMSVLVEDGMPSPPSDVDVDRLIGWVNREIYFESTPLRHVLDQLERWYDIRIGLIDPSIESDLITVYIDNRPLGDILETIAFIMKVEFDFNGRDIVFTPK